MFVLVFGGASRATTFDRVDHVYNRQDRTSFMPARRKGRRTLQSKKGRGRGDGGGRGDASPGSSGDARCSGPRVDGDVPVAGCAEGVADGSPLNGGVGDCGGSFRGSTMEPGAGDFGVEPAPYFLFSEREIKPIEWLWSGMIPIGKVTLLIGDPGIGKSLLAVDLAARLTRGEGIPPDRKRREPARVLFIAGDGETEDILPERLDRYGAVLSRVAGIEPQTGFRGGDSGVRGQRRRCVG